MESIGSAEQYRVRSTVQYVKVKSVLLFWMFMLPITILLSFYKPSHSEFSSTPDVSLRKETSDKRLEPIHLYLLIDESLTANLSDPERTIRENAVTQVLSFVVAYGWIAEAPPHLYIYQYSTVFDKDAGFTKEIWPKRKTNPPVSIEEFSTMRSAVLQELRSLEEKFKYQVEDPIETLKYIETLITKPETRKNSLVILLTQGSPIEYSVGKGGLSIEEILNAVSEEWDLHEVPIGVYLFGEDAQNLSIKWKEHLINRLKLDEEIYLLVDNPIFRDRQLWDWMLRMYDEQGRFYRTDVAYLEIMQIMPSRKSELLTFPFPIKHLKIITLLNVEENIILRWPSDKIESSDDAPPLRYWDLTSIPPNLVGEWKFGHKGEPVNYPVNSMISCLYLSTSTPTVTPSLTPITTLTITSSPTTQIIKTDITPSVTTIPVSVTNKNLILGSLLAIGLLLLITGFIYIFPMKQSPNILTGKVVLVIVIVLAMVILFCYVGVISERYLEIISLFCTLSGIGAYLRQRILRFSKKFEEYLKVEYGLLWIGLIFILYVLEVIWVFNLLKARL